MSTFVLDAFGSKAQGYIATPVRAGKFPGLLLLQYAGVYALNARGSPPAARPKSWHPRIDVDSHDKLPSGTRRWHAPRNYRRRCAFNSNRSRNDIVPPNMYLRDSRVLDYLMTRQDWDGKTIVLMGTTAWERAAKPGAGGIAAGGDHRGAGG